MTTTEIEELRTEDGTPIQDLETARDYLETLRLEMKDIEFQLGERNRLNLDGSRMSETEYWQWHGRAKRALLYRLKKQNLLRQYIRSQPDHARDLLERVGSVLAALRDGQSVEPSLATELLSELRRYRDIVA